jgi:hypothetical protein
MTLTLQKSRLVQATSTKKHELLPDFLIIGAGKSGTTSLDKYLNQHPEIFIPKLKEPNFYGYENTKVEDLNGDIAEILHFKGSVTNFEDYINLFRDAKPGQLKGETSNTYMYHPGAPERIKHYNPDMKLIAILRQPAGRLYSRFLHLARENRTPTPNFADCKDKNSIWWKRNDLVKEGFYYKNLLPYYKLFPKENIRVYLYEELNERPDEVLRDIYKFLGVDEEFKGDVSVRYNESGIIKNKFLNKIYGQKGLLTTMAKAILPKSGMQKLKSNHAVQRVINTLRGKNLVKPKMDPEIRRWLSHEVYGEDIKNLQTLIGKDLSHWLKA